MKLNRSEDTDETDANYDPLRRIINEREKY